MCARINLQFHSYSFFCLAQCKSPWVMVKYMYIHLSLMMHHKFTFMRLDLFLWRRINSHNLYWYYFQKSAEFAFIGNAELSPFTVWISSMGILKVMTLKCLENTVVKFVRVKLIFIIHKFYIPSMKYWFILLHRALYFEDRIMWLHPF